MSGELFETAGTRLRNVPFYLRLRRVQVFEVFLKSAPGIGDMRNAPPAKEIHKLRGSEFILRVSPKGFTPNDPRLSASILSLRPYCPPCISLLTLSACSITRSIFSPRIFRISLSE